MKASERSAFRFDAGINFVRYLQGLDPRQAPVTVISPTYISTQGNFQVATGYVFRFLTISRQWYKPSQNVLDGADFVRAGVHLITLLTNLRLRRKFLIAMFPLALMAVVWILRRFPN